jgi:hypothetical protein
MLLKAMLYPPAGEIKRSGPVSHCGFIRLRNSFGPSAGMPPAGRQNILYLVPPPPSMRAPRNTADAQAAASRSNRCPHTQDSARPRGSRQAMRPSWNRPGGKIGAHGRRTHPRRILRTRAFVSRCWYRGSFHVVARSPRSEPRGLTRNAGFAIIRLCAPPAPLFRSASARCRARASTAAFPQGCGCRTS